MKKNILVVLIFIWMASPLLAQPIFLTGEGALNEQQMVLKGNVSQISQRYSNRMGWVDFHFHSVKHFKNNQVVQQINKGDFGDTQITNTYKNGRLDRQEKKAINQQTGQLETVQIKTYQYRPGEVIIDYPKQEPNLNLSKEELSYDQYQRLVAYKKYNRLGQLLLDVAHTYNFETSEKQLLNTLKVSYANGKVEETRMLIYHSEAFSINGEACTKVRIEKSITPKNADQDRKETAYQYVKADGTPLRTTYHVIGVPTLYEWVYEYDERGNWISKAEYRKINRELQSYHQRKITYTDGLVSGSDEYDQKQIWDKTFVASSEQYYYKRFLEKKLVRVLDRNQKNISKSIQFLGNLKSQSAFLHHPDQQALIELVDYQLMQDEDFHEGRLLAEGIQNCLLKSSAGNFFVFNDNVWVTSFQQSTINKDIGIIFNPTTGETYKYQWSNLPVNEVLPLEQLPPTENHTYWVVVRTNEGTENIVVYKKGKSIDHKNIKFQKVGVSDAVLYDGEEILLIKNTTNAQLYQPYPVDYLSKKELAPLLAQNNATLSPTPSQTASSTTSSTKPTNMTSEPPAPKIDRSNFGCYNDIGCLNRKAIQVFQKTQQAGQGDDQAYQQMAQVFAQVYQNKPSLSFDMIMAVDGQYLMGIQKALPPDVRSYIRQKSQERVNQYTQKHGKPKIKTVPYQPKN